MNKVEIENKIIEIVAEEFEVEPSVITPDANIKAALELDSLSLVDLVSLIETTFTIKITSAELPKILTFQDLFNFVAEKTAK